MSLCLTPNLFLTMQNIQPLTLAETFLGLFIQPLTLAALSAKELVKTVPSRCGAHLAPLKTILCPTVLEVEVLVPDEEELQEVQVLGLDVVIFWCLQGPTDLGESLEVRSWPFADQTR